MKSNQLDKHPHAEKRLRPAKAPSKDPTPLLLPPKVSKSSPSQDSKIQHPHCVNRDSEKQSIHKVSSQQSITAKLESKFSSDSEPMIDNRVIVPSVAIMTRVPPNNPIEVVVYGDVNNSVKNLLGKDHRIHTKTDYALVDVKDVVYKINYNIRNIHPSFILYFPSVDYPLTDLQNANYRALYQIEYKDIEDAEIAQLRLRECNNLPNQNNFPKCDPIFADHVMVELLTHLRNEYLLRHQAIRVSAEVKQNNSPCCHS